VAIAIALVRFIVVSPLLGFRLSLSFITRHRMSSLRAKREFRDFRRFSTARTSNTVPARNATVQRETAAPNAARTVPVWNVVLK
jgi:hypothetical protein